MGREVVNIHFKFENYGKPYHLMGHIFHGRKYISAQKMFLCENTDNLTIYGVARISPTERN